MDPNQPNSFGGEAGGNTGSDVNGDIVLVPDTQNQGPKGEKILTTKMKIMIGIVGVMVIILGVFAIVMAVRGKQGGDNVQGDVADSEEICSSDDVFKQKICILSNYILYGNEENKVIPSDAEWTATTTKFYEYSNYAEQDDRSKYFERLKSIHEGIVEELKKEYQDDIMNPAESKTEKKDGDKNDIISDVGAVIAELVEGIGEDISTYYEIITVGVLRSYSIKKAIYQNDTASNELIKNVIDKYKAMVDKGNKQVSELYAASNELVESFKKAREYAEINGCIDNGKIMESCLKSKADTGGEIETLLTKQEDLMERYNLSLDSIDSSIPYKTMLLYERVINDSQGGDENE